MHVVWYLCQQRCVKRLWQVTFRECYLITMDQTQVWKMVCLKKCSRQFRWSYPWSTKDICKYMRDQAPQFPWCYKSQFKISYQTWEFDPGSGRTLAAGLTHASRTLSSERVADGWVTRGNLPSSTEQHREICANTGYALWGKDLLPIDGPALD